MPPAYATAISAGSSRKIQPTTLRSPRPVAFAGSGRQFRRGLGTGLQRDQPPIDRIDRSDRAPALILPAVTHMAPVPVPHAVDQAGGNSTYRGTGGSEALRLRLAWMCSSAAVKGATSSSGSGSKNNFLTNVK